MPAMSEMAESKVGGVIKALSALEDDLDSLNAGLGEMKGGLAARTQKEIDGLLAKTREMATKEAGAIIEKARTRAESESAGIVRDGDSRLKKIQSQIDAGLDDAVGHVVSTVLKA